jgi:hypothetical protein
VGFGGCKKRVLFCWEISTLCLFVVVVTKLKPSLLFNELRQAFCLSLKEVKLFKNVAQILQKG